MKVGGLLSLVSGDLAIVLAIQDTGQGKVFGWFLREQFTPFWSVVYYEYNATRSSDSKLPHLMEMSRTEASVIESCNFC